MGIFLWRRRFNRCWPIHQWASICFLSRSRPQTNQSRSQPPNQKDPGRPLARPQHPLPPKEKAKGRRGRQRKEGDQTFPTVWLTRTSESCICVLSLGARRPIDSRTISGRSNFAEPEHSTQWSYSSGSTTIRIFLHRNFRWVWSIDCCNEGLGLTGQFWHRSQAPGPLAPPSPFPKSTPHPP